MIYAVSTIWKKHGGRGNCRRNLSVSLNGDCGHDEIPFIRRKAVVKLATCRNGAEPKAE